MRTRVWVGAAVALVVAGSSWAQAPPAAAPAGKAGAKPGPAAAQAKPAEETRLKVKKIVLGVHHRAVHEFYDEVTTTLGTDFKVGDTKYTAKVLRFVPDFGIDMKTRQVFTKSDRLDNPAMQIATSEGGAPHDTSWAFLNFPPHFSKRALLAFQILRIEFENHAPVTPKNLPKIDSTSTGGHAR